MESESGFSMVPDHLQALGITYTACDLQMSLEFAPHSGSCECLGISARETPHTQKSRCPANSSYDLLFSTRCRVNGVFLAYCFGHRTPNVRQLKSSWSAQHSSPSGSRSPTRGKCHSPMFLDTSRRPRARCACSSRWSSLVWSKKW